MRHCITNITAILLLTLCLAACSSSGDEPGISSDARLNGESIGDNFSISNISSKGQTYTLQLEADGAWSISNTPDWTDIYPLSGSGNASVTLEVMANIGDDTRVGEFNVTAGGASSIVRLTQPAMTSADGELTYNLPVIFHVLYVDADDSLQYVKASRIREVLRQVNARFSGQLNNQSQNMNVSFYLTPHDEDGNLMDEPGVEYIKWNGTYPIDCNDVMTDSKKTYTDYIWDPNRFINVLLYNFKESDDDILGITHMPFTTKGSNELEGLNAVSYTHINKSQLNFAYCSSINSLYFYIQSTATIYNTRDVIATVTHELGHYLGLHHVFAEDSEGEQTHDCNDTDYCSDTPSYDRLSYVDHLNYLAQYQPQAYRIANLLPRTSCDGDVFEARNIMDYAVTLSNFFSEQQRQRVRHVLTYSPMIPGPKKSSGSSTRSDAPTLDLPIMVSHCPPTPSIVVKK